MNHNDVINIFCDNPSILKELEPFTTAKDKLGFINKLIEKTNCDFDTAKTVCDYLIEGIPMPSTLSPAEIAHNNAIAQEWQNKPKCPTCNSTNLKKISATSKVVNTAVFGLFGTKRHKTFHCNNCGYEW